MAYIPLKGPFGLIPKFFKCHSRLTFNGMKYPGPVFHHITKTARIVDFNRKVFVRGEDPRQTSVQNKLKYYPWVPESEKEIGEIKLLQSEKPTERSSLIVLREKEFQKHATGNYLALRLRIQEYMVHMRNG
ncbi:hypothetical protein CEXT_332791 [Caerostris extrusa]|uniref:Ribosomal protein S4 n=1 Tax=Caerostris extrusa TaxID=172846 RepID=A0AAV4MPC2_CAEEX|nr:hypothetical protein CEXT_332791 [Caerostris extrusa]